MKKGKAIKQHYNKILKDPEIRERHFKPSGALGSEKEGRDSTDKFFVELQNRDARTQLNTDHESIVQDRVEKLKKNGKIILGALE